MKKETSGQSNLTKGRSASPHMDGSIVFARRLQCVPHLTHASLGLPDSIPQTASRSAQPFFRAHDRDRVTDRPTVRQTTLTASYILLVIVITFTQCFSGNKSALVYAVPGRAVTKKHRLVRPLSIRSLVSRTDRYFYRSLRLPVMINFYRTQ